MTAAAERMALARIGESLVALAGPRGDRRVAPAGGAALPPATFADIAQAPDWLLQPRDDVVAFAVRAALVAMAPALATSIDGRWLRALAERAGEGALDHAITRADAVPDGGVRPVAIDATDALGFDLLRAALPPPLRRYLDWAPCGGDDQPASLARFAVREAAVGAPA